MSLKEALRNLDAESKGEQLLLFVTVIGALLGIILVIF